MRDELIQELAAKMGVAVDVLWGALLRQAPINGCVEIFFAVFMVGVTVGQVYLTKRVYAITKKDGDWSPLWIALGITWIIVVGMIFGVISSLPTTIAAFLNPDYWALNTILNAIRPAQVRVET